MPTFCLVVAKGPPWPIAHTVALHTTSERAPGQRQARRPSVGGDDAGPLSHRVLCCPLCWEVNHLNPHLHPLGCHHIHGPWEQLSSGKEEGALCTEQCSPPPSALAGSLAFQLL